MANTKKPNALQLAALRRYDGREAFGHTSTQTLKALRRRGWVVTRVENKWGGGPIVLTEAGRSVLDAS